MKSKTGVQGFSKQSLTCISPLPFPEFDETCAELCNLHASSIEMSEFQAAISKLQSKTTENNQITAKMPKAVDIITLTKLSELFNEAQPDLS